MKKIISNMLVIIGVMIIAWIVVSWLSVVIRTETQPVSQYNAFVILTSLK